MARIHFEIPDDFMFETNLKARIYDINYGNHLGNDRMVSLIHEARVEFFHSLGFEELKIEGTGILISDLAVIYKAEVFYGTSLKFQISVGDFNKYGCDIFYRIIDSDDGKLIATAKTGIVFRDKESGFLTGPPEVFLAKVSHKHV